MSTKIMFAFGAAVFCAALTSACSEGARLSPNAPSNLNAGGAASSDLIVRPSNARETTAEWAGARGWSTSADGLVVEGTDVITAVTGACPAPTITVRGVPVAVNGATTYGGSATCASLIVGTTVSVTGVVTFTVSGISVTASNIRVGGGTPSPSGATKVKGVIATATGACPSLTMTLEGAGDVVVTSPTTQFDPITICALLAPVAKVQAWGARNATNQLVATKLELDTDNDDDDDDTAGGGGQGRKVGGEGVIGAITGACPTLTAVIGGYRVQLSGDTEFIGSSCESLRPGTKVMVDALLNADGSVVAEKVEIQRIPGRPVSGDGRVDTVDGTCPLATLSVKGVIVILSDRTALTGGTCASIQPGTHVDVTGNYDGVSVAATSVAIRNPGRR